jgi:hypothetical protein
MFWTEQSCFLIYLGMTHPEQLGFGFEQIEEEKETAHLPSNIEERIAAYRQMLEQHNQAMVAGDEKRVMEIRKEANRLSRGGD